MDPSDPGHITLALYHLDGFMGLWGVSQTLC
jgi:hypothetical protein